MKKLIIPILILACSIGTTAIAQQPLVLDRLMTDRSLQPQTLQHLQWLNNTSVIYQEQGEIKVVDLLAKTTRTLFTLAELNTSMKAIGLEQQQTLPAFTVKGAFLSFFADNRYLQIDPLTLKTEMIKSIPYDAKNIDTHYPTRRIAYTRDHDQALVLLTDNTRLMVSPEIREGVKDGIAVHRREFGINKGTFFSPDGQYLAFYNLDESMVTNYPLVDINTRIASVKNERYPMSGKTSENVQVGVFNINTFDVVFLRSTFDREAYRTNIAWSPDAKAIYVATVSRDQKTMSMRQYDPANGRFVRTLFEETSPRYVEPMNPMVFVPGSPNLFVWQSQRDGYNHLYLYDTDGRLVRQITQGPWVVKQLVGFSPRGDRMYFTATRETPLETHLYSTSVARPGAIERITQVPGNHRITMSPDGRQFITQFSNLETPNTIQVINLNGRVIETLLEAPNPLENYTLGTTTIETIKAADGTTDLYGRLIKPHDFDPSKTYPVIIYVYGGPHSQMVTNSWLGGANLFFNFLAQQGYLVWALDNRGTNNRGFEFESVIHRQLGTVEVADQMEGVKFLKSLPYVDPERIGVDGWSYGGFMSMSMKLQHPGVFKVATAGGPVVDWKWYEAMYTERYMETPEDNPYGYAAASLLSHVDKLEGKLLVIHGAQDDVVVWQHSLAFLAEAIKKGKHVDYFVYPNHAHNVRGADRTHLLQMLYHYFRDNL